MGNHIDPSKSCILPWMFLGSLNYFLWTPNQTRIWQEWCQGVEKFQWVLWCLNDSFRSSNFPVPLKGPYLREWQKDFYGRKLPLSTVANIEKKTNELIWLFWPKGGHSNTDVAQECWKLSWNAVFHFYIFLLCQNMLDCLKVRWSLERGQEFRCPKKHCKTSTFFVALMFRSPGRSQCGIAEGCKKELPNCS